MEEDLALPGQKLAKRAVDQVSWSTARLMTGVITYIAVR